MRDVVCSSLRPNAAVHADSAGSTHPAEVSFVHILILVVLLFVVVDIVRLFVSNNAAPVVWRVADKPLPAPAVCLRIACSLAFVALVVLVVLLFHADATLELAVASPFASAFSFLFVVIPAVY